MHKTVGADPLVKPDLPAFDAGRDTGNMRTWPIRQLGGLLITVASRAKVAEGFIEEAIRHRGTVSRPFYSTSANGQVMALCHDEPALEAEFARADQILADGMPMVLYSQFSQGLSLPERVATTDLFHDVAERAAAKGVTFYLLGAEESVNAATFSRMSAQYPGLSIVGRQNGYFSTEEEADIVSAINAAKPDILWVAMGVPREQYFISRNIDRLTGVGVIKTSGGLFDFLSTKRSRAPGWMQAVGLEWAWRAALEPRRLGIRYLMTNPKALKLLFTRS